MAKTKARELVQFGSNVRKRRETRDWTQEQLAEMANLDQTYTSWLPYDWRQIFDFRFSILNFQSRPSAVSARTPRWRRFAATENWQLKIWNR